jgi:hypothetical protein
MRKLILLALLAVPSWSSIAVVAHNKQSCVGGPCTTGNLVVDSTGATLIIATLNTASGSDCNTNPTLTDSRGNTWVKGTSSINSTCTVQWRAYNHAGSALSVGSGHTFSVTGNFISFSILVLSGTQTGATDPLNKEGAGTSTAGGTSLAASSILCDNPNSIVVTTMSAHKESTGGYSADSGFTVSDWVSFVGGNTAGLGTAYLLQSGSPATVTPTWSGLNSASNISTTIACYNGATATASKVARRVID